jgi:FkbM family methyltransferase
MAPLSQVGIRGYSMCVDFRDNASFKYLVDRERYEAAGMDAFVSVLARFPDAWAVDVGASYGAFALCAAKACEKGTGRGVLAFEPDRRAYHCLERSRQINHLGSTLRLFNAIVSDRDGAERLFVNARSSADNRSHAVGSSPIRVADEYDVRCISIDSALRECGVPPGSTLAVKIDIQGNEFRAFRGMAASLRSAARWWVLFEHFPYLIRSAGIDIGEYKRWLLALDFEEACEVDSGLSRLDGRAGLAAALERLEHASESHIEGAGSDFIISRGIPLA